MTDIEAKALALWNAVRAERQYTYEHTSINRHSDMAEALYRAIESHEAFKQEVSDAMKEYCKGHGIPNYDRFIIPKPKSDPLVEIIELLNGEWTPDEYANAIRTALDAAGFEIREINT